LRLVAYQYVSLVIYYYCPPYRVHITAPFRFKYPVVMYWKASTHQVVCCTALLPEDEDSLILLPFRCVHRKMCEGRRESQEQRWKRVESSKESKDSETQYEK